MMAKYKLKPITKRTYHRDSTMSKAGVMLIMILFHDSCYCCLKRFYMEKVCRRMRHLFPNVVSYNRFVEPGKEMDIPLALFIKKVFGADVQASASLTAPHYGYAGIRESISIRHSIE